MHQSADEQNDMPGGDSFLDIVANIVGILVLLVVVVGVRASRQVTVLARVETVDPSEIIEEAEEAIHSALVERKQLNRMVDQVSFLQAEALLRNQVRDEFATDMASRRIEIDEERKQLSEGELRTFDTQNELAQVKTRLAKLEQEDVALMYDDSPSEIEQIKFDTTPIVSERVTKDIKFRLEGGRVAHLPMDDLKQEVLDTMLTLGQSPRLQLGLLNSRPEDIENIEKTMGPYEGFVFHCLFRPQLVATRDGVSLRCMPIQMVLEDRGAVPSETVAEAMTPGSLFLSHLETINPKKSVVTLMTYPDSYGAFVELKKALRERGFNVADSLQIAGVPIGFSPNGRETVLQ